MKNYFISIIFLFLIVLIISYIIFNMIINKIDSKLNNIKINLPSQEIKIKYPEQIENFENNINIVENKNYNNDNNEEQIDSSIDKDFFQNNNVEGFEKIKNDDLKDWENPVKCSHMCFENHKHYKCNLGVMNYPDPKDLSQMDYNIFTLNYPPNMTLQDYINWLYCFCGKEYQLPYNHLKNLEKLKSGEKLIEKKGVLPPPSYKFPPLTSEEYFKKMYNANNEFDIAAPLNSQTGPMLGYNYNEFSEFSQNDDLYGSSSYIRNCDIKEKKNAKNLHNYIFPKNSNQMQVTKEYDIYRHKNVEI